MSFRSFPWALTAVFTACALSCSSPNTDRTPAPDAEGGAPTDLDSGVTPAASSPGPVSQPPDSGTNPSSDDAGVTDEDGGQVNADPHALIINEVMAVNDGTWIDAVGETDDWVELMNPTEQALELSDYTLEDDSGKVAVLPAGRLQPGQYLLLWADDTPEQGATHLPFKISSQGDRLTLRARDGSVADSVEVTAAVANESFLRLPDASGEFTRCRYATPGRSNGTTCTPPPPPSLPESTSYEPYSFPQPFPALHGPLVVSELALKPARFVELMNTSSASVDLSDFVLRLSPHAPGLPWPDAEGGVEVVLPGATLQPGAQLAVEVDATLEAALLDDPLYEGVLTLFARESSEVVERVDFMHWPTDAALARVPDAHGIFRYCSNVTPGETNVCDALASREVGDRLRYLRTPGDFAALANGETQLGIRGVKFVLDMAAGDVVHLLGMGRWPLHYTFVRELIDGDPPLDRCNEAQRQEFDQGWYDFSVSEYFTPENRRFLLGTLNHHSGADIKAVEHAIGDTIVGQQMKQAFFSVVSHTLEPEAWVLRPQDAAQAERARDVDGELPIISPEAPFRDVTFQPLTEGVAYGTLKFVESSALHQERLGPDVIVITDDVPNDIPLVGGLITEAFQTPLAHVNVLSQSRGTPNAALKDARSVLAEHLGKLVRLEVSGAGIAVSEADLADAQEYWDSFKPQGPTVTPRLDLSVRGVQPLSAHSLESLPIIGAKAAQLAELGRVDTSARDCPSTTTPLPLPYAPFAIPVVHYREHFEASGASLLLQELADEPSFDTDPVARATALGRVRQLMLDHPMDAALLAEVESAIEERHGNARVRFRSSSNTEDLPHFNGAGLYTSVGTELDSAEQSVEDAVRMVWASLWNARAYDERLWANIDETNVAMGVLIHPAFRSERANGVAVSRNVLDLTRGDIFYINVQAGEASVTNPAPGISTEQLVYRWNRTPRLMYQSESSLLGALEGDPQTVMTPVEAEQLACALAAVHDWFRPLLDPEEEESYFAMEVEFKFIGETRELLIKQARPHSFGGAVAPGDCREL